MSATNLELHAAGFVDMVTAAPAFTWQTGEWAAAITDNGAGDVTLTFNAANGIAATEAVWKCTVVAAAARISIAVDLLTVTTARIRVFDEATAGLIDRNFTVLVWRKNIV